MEPSKVAFENIGATQNKFDTVIEYLLGGMLVFMPLVFGARNVWTEEVVIALSGCIVICFLLKLIVDRNQRIVWTWAYVLVGLFVLIVLLQLISLPSGLLSKVCPNTVRLRTELLWDLPQAEELLKSMTVSLYPNGTKHDLRLVLSVAAVFFVVLSASSASLRGQLVG